MVIAVRAEEVDDTLVVVKEARSDGDVSRLTREVAMLGQARHPGVVAVLDVGPRSVRLAHGGTALARLGPFPLHVTAGILAAVADIVSAVHRSGVVHGDLDGNHVVLDRSGTPRLCGFGQAEPHTPAGEADDVAALGRMLGSLLAVGRGLPTTLGRRAVKQARRDLEALSGQAQHEDRHRRPSARQFAKAIHAAVPEATLPEDTTAPARGEGFAAIPDDVGPTSDLGWTAEDLSFLAVEGGGDTTHTLSPTTTDPYAALTGENPVVPPVPPARRPVDPGIERPTIAVADRLDADGVEVPTAITLRERVPAPPVRRRFPFGRLAVGAVVLAGGIVGGAVGVRALDPLDTFGDEEPLPTTSAPEPAEPAEPAEPSTPTTVVTGRRVPPTWPERCDVPDPSGPDVDGDGCPEPVEFLPEPADDAALAVQIGPVRFDLGRPGDLVALGDWTCDGVATPALLRPTTGEVFVFPTWEFDRTVERLPTATLEGAESIDATDDRCPLPLVVTATGPVVVDIDP